MLFPYLHDRLYRDELAILERELELRRLLPKQERRHRFRGLRLSASPRRHDRFVVSRGGL